jgi:hypothetical protein
MTFGYSFKPSVVGGLATGWNELESNRLINNIQRSFLPKIEGEWSFVR